MRLISMTLAIACFLMPAAIRADDSADFDVIYRRAKKLQDDEKYADSAAAFEKALALAKKIFGADHSDTGAIMGNLAGVYETLGEYDKALPLYESSLKIAEIKFGKDHEITGSAINNLAELFRRTANYERAEPLYLRSLAISELRNGKDHRETAKTLDNLGSLYLEKRDLNKVEKLFLRALTICETKLGKDDPLTAVTLNNLAQFYDEKGQYARAEPLLKRSLAIHERSLGAEHPETATVLNNLASLTFAMGQFDRAESLFKRSLAIREGKLGKDHPAVAAVLHDLAFLYKHQGQFDKAEPLYQRAIKIRETKLGSEHPATVETLNNLAMMWAAGQSADRAETLLKWILEVTELKFGKDHPATGRAANNLAGVFVDTKQYDKAGPLFERALAIQDSTYGKSHPTNATILNNMALLAAIRKDWPAATDYRDRSRRAARTFVAETLPILSEKDQERFLKETDANRFHAALSHGLARRMQAKERDLSASWLLNGKAVSLQSQAERTLFERDGRDPRAASLVKLLQDVRRQAAALTLEVLQPGQEPRPRELSLLNDQTRSLLRDLAAINGGISRAATWVELASVRSGIPPDAVLIEIARFDRKKLDATVHENDSLGAHYAAWIIPAKGEIAIVDLGSADAIESAVREVRKQLVGASRAIRDKGEPAAEKALRKPMEQLAKLVVEPLLPHIRETKTWIVSPDGLLWLVPWAALPVGDKYAIESHDIRYVTSGRDLANRPAKPKSTASIILADPDYNLGLSEAEVQLRKLLTGELVEHRGLSRDFRIGNIQRLQGTADEAVEIRPLIKKFTGQEPKLLMGRQALVGVFKAIKNPRVVVLGTHGYFLEDEVIDAKNSTFIDESSSFSRVAENPLLRCGLLLAGCNNATRAGPGQDNGVLTGLEIVGTDLRGTELVVLSACDTGLGDVRNGEGVAGLQQAFQLAGAETVVATLWEIPDIASANLMVSFFTGLAAGQTRDRALSNAQRDAIAKRRDRFGAAHPFFWGAFTLTGKGK